MIIEIDVYRVNFQKSIDYPTGLVFIYTLKFLQVDVEIQLEFSFENGNV